MTLPDPPYAYRATILSVHDGDSLTCDVDLGFRIRQTMPLRLLGLDAPELRTEQGRAARDWLTARLPAGTIVLVRTVRDRREKYGRLLADVTDQAGSVNTDLLVAGHATPYSGGRRTQPEETP